MTKSVHVSKSLKMYDYSLENSVSKFQLVTMMLKNIQSPVITCFYDQILHIVILKIPYYAKCTYFTNMS